MQLLHLYQIRRLDKMAHSKFWQLEFAIWLHIFARTIIGIFVPILLLQIGYTLGQVMLYYFLFTGINVPLNFLAKAIVQKIGARYVMMLSTLASLLFFVGLYLLTPNSWILFLITIIFAAIYDAFYFVSHIYLFIKSEDSARSQKDTSLLYIVKMGAALIGPIIGAIILILTNRHVLIVASAFFFALSILPLFHLKNLPDKPTRKTPSFKKFFKEKIDRQNFLSFAFFTIHRAAEGILWPLFIYTIFSSIQSVAYIPIIISLTVILFSYLMGKSQKYRKENLIIFGSLLIGLIWLLRLLTVSTPIYYFSIFLVSLLSLLVTIPLDSDIFARAKKISTLNTATYRNASSMLIQFLLFGILALVTNIFQVGFVITILTLLVLLLINYVTIKTIKA
ncbi:MAG: hypothetical protein COU10_00610 [Candidatus Harrisonbacteria bacterium CG10_big_fil_rev_8_21_14_0_10_45_28]|uniref:Major facilitator superfamily (MFS) profile domain-containing protein n=1 Tax=Candidatus Harrisonbacteria bacterium CG10_big_fil_rev_8_21_14_0_10_45_28 TaxID=1974586 RepID=A0A2H0UP39_9BACT|nr:MAG: hypothetical protein COU10_00610 [Candidatus Harrisonbacteria bacterium CG10_big_fil_rev_8_21_14_0_10_45_28]